MTTKIIAEIQPQQKQAEPQHIIYAALRTLETALADDEDFMARFHSSNFHWPFCEGVPLRSIAYWLLFEAERCGNPTAAFSKLDEYIRSPHRTWQHTVVCSDVTAQANPNSEPWQFSNGIAAYVADLPNKSKVITDEKLLFHGLTFLDQDPERTSADFIECVWDCCRSLSFILGEGNYIRPSYHTYTFDTSAPFPLGSIKRWISPRKNQVLGILTADTFEQADTLLTQLQKLKPTNLDVVRRVLDRHAGAVVWGDVENRAIEARICMEMILMRNSMGDNTFKVSRRAAYLIAKDPLRRMDEMKRAKLLYEAGSKAVHGGSLAGSKNRDLELSAAVKLCHEFLQELVQAWIAIGALDLSDEDWALVELGGDFPTVA